MATAAPHSWPTLISSPYESGAERPRTVFSTASYSACRPVAFFEEISSPSTTTSNTPPVAGFSVSSPISFSNSSRSLSARPTALGE